MSVVNYRLDYKQFVLWYSSIPKLTVHDAVCPELSFMFAVEQRAIN